MAPGGDELKSAYTVEDVLTPRTIARHRDLLAEEGHAGIGVIDSSPFPSSNPQQKPQKQAQPRGAWRQGGLAPCWLGSLLALSLLMLAAASGLFTYTQLGKGRAAGGGRSVATAAVSPGEGNVTDARLRSVESSVDALQDQVLALGNSTTTIGLDVDALKQRQGVVNVDDLSKALDQLKAQQATMQAQQATMQAQSDAKLQALCQAITDQAGASPDGPRTTIICQVQTNWQLPCAGAVVTEAKLGRFTSSPTGPCVDQGVPSAWAVCPEALDLTDQVKQALAAAPNGLVAASPVDIMNAAKAKAPCKGYYLQLQIVHSCPNTNTAEARLAKCKTLIAGATPSP